MQNHGHVRRDALPIFDWVSNIGQHYWGFTDLMNQIGKNTIGMINSTNKRSMKIMKTRTDKVTKSHNISSFACKMCWMISMLIAITLLPIVITRDALGHATTWPINKHHFEEKYFDWDNDQLPKHVELPRDSPLVITTEARDIDKFGSWPIPRANKMNQIRISSSQRQLNSGQIIVLCTISSTNWSCPLLCQRHI